MLVFTLHIFCTIFRCFQNIQASSNYAPPRAGPGEQTASLRPPLSSPGKAKPQKHSENKRKRENIILALHSVVSGLCPPLTQHNCYQTPATLVRVTSGPLKQRYLSVHAFFVTFAFKFFYCKGIYIQMYWDGNVDIWGQIDLSGSE